MLKKLETFFVVASYGKIYLFFLAVFTAVYLLIGSIIAQNFNNTSMLQISFCIAALTAIFGVWSVYCDRKNHMFWSMARELETKIDQANDINEILDLYNEQWKMLKEVAYNKSHTYEVLRLCKTMETKYEILKTSNVAA